MKINDDNYQAYFLDLAEGSLSDSDKELLYAFLENHPELKSELENFEDLEIESPPKVYYNLKDSLKREETTSLLENDYLMISQVENIISIEEKALLAERIEFNPELLDELAVYHKTKLKGEKVNFDGKSELIQAEKKAILWWKYFGSAAAAVLALFFFNHNKNAITKKYNPIQLQYSNYTVPEDSPSENSYAFSVKEEEIPIKHQTALRETPGMDLNPRTTFIPKKNKEKSIASQDNSPDRIEIANLDKDVIEETTTPNDERDLPRIETQPQQTKPTPRKEIEYLTVKEFAKQKLLKGKTFSETILEEITEVAEEKLDLTIDISNKDEKLAINIGKFSFSRNK